MHISKKVVFVTVTGLALTASAGIAGNAATRTITKKTVVKTVSNIAKPAGFMGRGGFAGGGLDTALKSLVTKGTITQAQADALKSELAAQQSAEKTARDAQMAAHDTLIANTIGIDVTTLKSRMAAGESLATIAGSKKDALIAALVAQENSEIDAAVTAGKLTSAQATTEKSEVTQRVTNMVNNVRPKDGSGPMGGRGGRGGHGPMGMSGTTNGIPNNTSTTPSN